MTKTASTDLHPQAYITGDGTTVEAILIDTADDVRALRDSAWSDNQVRALTFETAEPIAFVALEPPFELGTQIRRGDFVVKHPTGVLEVVSPLPFSMKYSKVAG